MVITPVRDAFCRRFERYGGEVGTVGALWVAAFAVAAAGCSSASDGDFVARFGDADFRWGFGVDSAEQLYDILVTSYHLSSVDADCAVASIFSPDLRGIGCTVRLTPSRPTPWTKRWSPVALTQAQSCLIES
jgi:hypothetical protein